MNSESRGFNPEIDESIKKRFQVAEESTANRDDMEYKAKKARIKNYTKELDDLRQMENELHEKEEAHGRRTPQMDQAYDSSNIRAKEILSSDEIVNEVHLDALVLDSSRTKLIELAGSESMDLQKFNESLSTIGSPNFVGMWETISTDTRNILAEKLRNYASTTIEKLRNTSIIVNHDKYPDIFTTGKYIEACKQFPEFANDLTTAQDLDREVNKSFNR